MVPLSLTAAAVEQAAKLLLQDPLPGLSAASLPPHHTAMHPPSPHAADPHPGNLIRTPDGRLAILDFGLMTKIDDSVKVRG